jgi:hypothetical protein
MEDTSRSLERFADEGRGLEEKREDHEERVEWSTGQESSEGVWFTGHLSSELMVDNQNGQEISRDRLGC